MDRPARQPKPRPRTAARVAAVQALFQSEQAQTNPEAVIDEFLRHRLGRRPGNGGYDEGRVPDADATLFARIVRSVAQQQDSIDRQIAANFSLDWPIGRLDPVLRAVMRAAAAELSMPDGPPTPVVINEYLDVAHGFFTGDEPRMANGVLDSLARQLRPQDFPAA